MKIEYVPKNFQQESMRLIDIANEIIEDYRLQGFDLTLRQLYYQFVSRTIIKNDEKQYKRLGSIINDARLAGLIDWDAISDRTRMIRQDYHNDSIPDILNSAAYAFSTDKWEGQEWRPEVWIEKDALVDVISDVCYQNDVPHFSCRGYVSQSSMYEAAQRMIQYREENHYPIIIHLGDHDPSGIDMTRDIKDRLSLLTFGSYIEVNRIALNMNQIDEYQPPPNPTKIKDSRSDNYIKNYGYESWELDAINPSTLSDMVLSAINSYKNEYMYDIQLEKEKEGRSKIRELIDSIS